MTTQMHDAILRENEAEQKWLSAALVPSISDLLTTISVNKLAGNWRSYRKKQNTDKLSGLWALDTISLDFLGYWSCKDKEIKARSSDPSVFQDVRVYVAGKIWDQKLADDFFINANVRTQVFAHRFVFRKLRQQIHEAISRAVKTYEIESSSDQLQRLTDRLDATIKGAFLDVIHQMNDTLNLNGVIGQISPPKELQSDSENDKAA
ncbi:MAG: hypothetical protein AAGA75_17910 [Cyanobacteria bacterium P01_E01_bin.6]